MNDGAKFAVFDLLKVLDVIFDGRHHEVFRHIAWDNLNLALPALPPPPPDPPAPAPGSKAEAAGLPSDPTPCPEPEVDSVADSAADSSGVPAEPEASRVADSGGAGSAARRESEQDRVLRFLAAQTEPVGLSRIVVELGIKRWTVNSVLYRLLKRGSVEHPGRDVWRARGTYRVRRCA